MAATDSSTSGQTTQASSSTSGNTLTGLGDTFNISTGTTSQPQAAALGLPWYLWVGIGLAFLIVLVLLFRKH